MNFESDASDELRETQLCCEHKHKPATRTDATLEQVPIICQLASFTTLALRSEATQGSLLHRLCFLVTHHHIYMKSTRT